MPYPARARRPAFRTFVLRVSGSDCRCRLSDHACSFLFASNLRGRSFRLWHSCARSGYVLSRFYPVGDGVRARLIDRDNRPRWHWPDVARLDAAVVEAHFAPAWEGEHPLADLRDS